MSAKQNNNSWEWQREQTTQISSPFVSCSFLSASISRQATTNNQDQDISYASLRTLPSLEDKSNLEMQSCGRYKVSRRKEGGRIGDVSAVSFSLGTSQHANSGSLSASKDCDCASPLCRRSWVWLLDPETWLPGQV